MARWILIAVVFCFAGALCAQPPIPPDTPPPVTPKDPPVQPAPPQPVEPDPYVLEKTIDERLARALDELTPLRSRKQLFVEFGGGINIKYRQTQKNDLRDIPDGGHRAPSGFGLDSAWLSVGVNYSDLVEAQLELRYNGNYSLYNQDILEIPRAWVCYNRPISQFNFFAAEYFTDNFLVGMEGHFYRQPHGGETMALGHRAFYEDEILQARYTIRFMKNFYAIAALTDGNLLGRTQVDESNNYPLLADDITRYFRGLDNPREIDRFLAIEFGGGLIFDFNATSFLNSTAPFIPERVVSQNTNFAHLQVFCSIDRLSKNELALIEGMQRLPFRGGTPGNPIGETRRQKVRYGANVDFAVRLAEGDLYLQAHFIHAEDGRFVRNAYGVEVRYTVPLPRIPFFLRITPMFRFSELLTNNNDNPLDETDPLGKPFRVSSGSVSGFTLADAAGFSADRREIMLGISFAVARNVSFSFEMVLNDENFKQTRSIARDVPNTLYLLRLIAEF
ncbi:MAG: hypothetical protein IT462_02830 [Planctomycetes bacterium]|nr:hypothetical protein [Planctomycetota bacterium]